MNEKEEEENDLTKIVRQVKGMRRKHLGVISNKVSWVGISQPTVGVDYPSGNVKHKKQNLMDPYLSL